MYGSNFYGSDVKYGIWDGYYKSIMQFTLFMNGMFLSMVGRVYILSPQNHTQWGYKNEVVDGPALHLLDIIGEFFQCIRKVFFITKGHFTYLK
jgi:hypothetical protein